ncbi:hypothetical protein HP550_21010 [Cellulomonas humilata]|uniref:Lipoprotein n=1 Tax=Cellulomonas humilata TaxID=144055 RepID=A0A7Y6A4Y7_9CELL|nr:hypothetical protein [Cellulomonas humilata]NUU19730.1 hypothetical protein [Cellulomonas humilata]
MARGAAVVVVGTALAACVPARPASTSAVDVAVAFYDAVDRADGGAACDLLAPVTVESLEDDADESCSEAVLDGEVGETLTARTGDASGSATVAGRQAQVVLADDVLFLTVSGTTWRIVAAGCDPRPDRPYDCVLEGA